MGRPPAWVARTAGGTDALKNSKRGRNNDENRGMVLKTKSLDYSKHCWIFYWQRRERELVDKASSTGDTPSAEPPIFACSTVFWWNKRFAFRLSCYSFDIERGKQNSSHLLHLRTRTAQRSTPTHYESQSEIQKQEILANTPMGWAPAASPSFFQCGPIGKLMGPPRHRRPSFQKCCRMPRPDKEPSSVAYAIWSISRGKKKL